MTDCYRFNNAELRPAEHLVRVDGEAVAVGARAFDLLLALIERRDRVVPKGELLDLVWPGLVVEENNLQVQVSALRKLLGADTITTVAGRGYRFTARLEGGAAASAPGVTRAVLEGFGAGGDLVLLWTDIVDSTRVNALLGDSAMASVWREHDRLSRELVRRWSGQEIGRSDGFLLLFTSVSNALGFAIAYHRALQDLHVPLIARVGVHLGPATVRENTGVDCAQGATRYEVDGVAVPIAARTMALAQGGQTLLTANAARALGPTSLQVQSHGFWQLKGLSEVLELFEAGSDRALFAPPPDSDKAYRVARAAGMWLPRREVPNSLPPERDAFVGRAAALQALDSRFAGGARLLSLLGPGGTGKTRMATRFGWSRLGDFSGGVWFCDLSQAHGINGILQAVAQGLQVPLSQADPLAQLARAMAGRGNCLVVLDNFEQLAQHAQVTLGRWLDSAPLARFLVTTRVTLGLAGEELLMLSPLLLDDGIDLFFKRAHAVRPGITADAMQHAVVRQLVDLLDGLPLAIELAAARAIAMSPAMILQRMGDRFRLLASNGAGRHDRHSTLRKAFDWSWELLSDDERSALAQLSVFDGGWTLAAAEAVLRLHDMDPAAWPVDLLQSLVQKSLVVVRDDGRFELLGSIRDYAAEHLAQPGRFVGSGADCAAAATVRHFCFFAALDEQAAVAQRCVEIRNLEVACRRAVARQDGTAAVGALVGAWAAFKLRGPFLNGIELADAVRAVPGLQPADRAVADWVAGSALFSLGRLPQARERLDAGLAAARDSGDATQQSRLLCALGEWFTTAGSGGDAARCLDEALAFASAAREPVLELRALNALGAAAFRLGHLQQAQAHYEGALALARAQRDLRWQGGLLGNLGGLWHTQGRLDLARPCYEQALDMSRQSGDRRWEGNNLCNLGLLHHDEGRHDAARMQFEAALKTARELGNPRLEGTALCNLGIVAEAQGALDAALTYYEQAVVSADGLGDRRSEGEFRGYLGRLLGKLGRLQAARDCLLLAELQLVAAGDKLNLGVVLCALADVEFVGGDPDLARGLLDRAEKFGIALSAKAESELRIALAACRQRVG